MAMKFQRDACLVANGHPVTAMSHIVLYATLFISITTAWRIIFNQLIGKWCGRHYASRKCDKLKKPSLIIQYESDHQNKWKLNALNIFCQKNKTQLKTCGFRIQSQNKQSLNTKLTFLKNSLNCSLSQIVEYVSYIHQTEEYERYCHKFSEECWKCITMLFVTLYGFVTMYDADYLYDTKLLYKSWPQPYSESMERYYMIAIGYHGHRAVWQMFDTIRKDFWAMSIHHWVTMILIVMSWYFGVMQSGCIVLVLHDNADFLLSAVKICKYSEYKRLTSIFFFFLVVSWIVCRIGLFLWKIIYSLVIEASGIYDCHWAFPWFLISLVILLLLHFYWGHMLLKMAFGALNKQEITDCRSESDNED